MPDGPSHTDAFAAFQAQREAARAHLIKVTWRKVSADTGGGWSGLGPRGALVYVKRTSSGYAYGWRRLSGKTPVVLSTEGYAATLARAKRAAEELFNDNGGTAAREEATVAAETNAPTPESLMEGLGEALTPDKAPYARLRVEAGTLGYAIPRNYGVMLDLAAAAVEGAPKRFASSLVPRGRNRTTFRVTAKNEKAARALLEWMAKQLG